MILANLGEEITIKDVEKEFYKLVECEDQLGPDGKEEEYSSKIGRIIEKLKNNFSQQSTTTTSIINYNHSNIQLELI